MIEEVELSEVDDYIAQHKTMLGYIGVWTEHYGRQWQTRWPIIDAQQSESGELCMTVAKNAVHASIICVFRQRLIHRLDVAPISECKSNHHTAWLQKLPFEVCGSHVHGWPENREYVRVNGFGKMPVRRPINGLVETLADGIGWIANDLNIQIAPDQRTFDTPPVQLV